jgi:glucokinase
MRSQPNQPTQGKRMLRKCRTFSATRTQELSSLADVSASADQSRSSKSCRPACSPDRCRKGAEAALGADEVTLAAVDLGGTHLRSALVDSEGRLTRHSRVRTDLSRSADQVIEALRSVIGGDSVGGAVVGVPGRVNRTTGQLEHARNLNPAWSVGLNAAALSDAVGVPVVLAGDVELAAIGESYFGAGTLEGDTAYLTLSTGVGAASTSQGRLVSGRRVGLQIGFLRPAGLSGPILDTLASGQQLDAFARDLGLHEMPVNELHARAAKGHPDAARVWCQLLGNAQWAAVSLCHICNPDVLVIGGGIANAGEPLRGPIAEAVASDLSASGMVVAVRLGALGDNAGLAGAAAWAKAIQSMVETERGLRAPHQSSSL